MLYLFKFHRAHLQKMKVWMDKTGLYYEVVDDSINKVDGKGILFLCSEDVFYSDVWNAKPSTLRFVRDYRYVRGAVQLLRCLERPERGPRNREARVNHFLIVHTDKEGNSTGENLEKLY